MKLTALLFKALLKNMGSVSQGRRLYLQWMIVTGKMAARHRNCRWAKVAECKSPSRRQSIMGAMVAIHGRPGSDRWWHMQRGWSCRLLL